MKRKDLKKCFSCKKRVMHSQSPMFTEIKISQYVLFLKEIHLEVMLGSSQLAAAPGILGEDDEIAKSISNFSVILCQTCLWEKRFYLPDFVKEE